MSKASESTELPLPKAWSSRVRSAMLQVICLAQYATIYTRSWAANSCNARVRLQVQNDQLQQEVALVRAEIRLKDARMTCLAPARRPHYPPAERLEILQLRAARGWSLQQTADTFLVTAATMASWMKRLEESGPAALVQLRSPVNKFPDFVRYAVQQLQALCPSMGKKKLAEILARAGLHLGTTTIGRIRKEQPLPSPLEAKDSTSSTRIVTAKRPNHVWHIDLTTMPTQAGFWCSWLPLTLAQRAPFCWWIIVLLDQYSRRVMGHAVFPQAPTALAVRSFLGRAIHNAGTVPKYLISDKGSQFWPTAGYQRWCRRRGIRPRFGAIGKHGSIAVVERLIRTIKDNFTHRHIPLRRQAMRQELSTMASWYNERRPHTALRGRTPNEVYFRRFSAHRRPRVEPRPYWPRGASCAQPQVLVAGQPGDRFTLRVQFQGGRRRLPIVSLMRAA
jgi:putative transposase